MWCNELSCVVLRSVLGAQQQERGTADAYNGMLACIAGDARGW